MAPLGVVPEVRSHSSRVVSRLTLLDGAYFLYLSPLLSDNDKKVCLIGNKAEQRLYPLMSRSGLRSTRAHLMVT